MSQTMKLSQLISTSYPLDSDYDFVDRKLQESLENNDTIDIAYIVCEPRIGQLITSYQLKGLNIIDSNNINSKILEFNKCIKKEDTLKIQVDGRDKVKILTNNTDCKFKELIRGNCSINECVIFFLNSLNYDWVVNNDLLLVLHQVAKLSAGQIYSYNDFYYIDGNSIIKASIDENRKTMLITEVGESKTLLKAINGDCLIPADLLDNKDEELKSYIIELCDNRK